MRRGAVARYDGLPLRAASNGGGTGVAGTWAGASGRAACAGDRSANCAEPYVVGGFLLRHQETDFRRGYLIQEPCRQRDMWPELIAPQMGRLPRNSRLDDFAIVFKRSDAQQAIVMRRLLFRWNPQPLVIRIDARRLSRGGRRRPCHRNRRSGGRWRTLGGAARSGRASGSVVETDQVRARRPRRECFDYPRGRGKRRSRSLASRRSRMAMNPSGTSLRSSHTGGTGTCRCAMSFSAVLLYSGPAKGARPVSSL